MTLQEHEKQLRDKLAREETGQNLIRIERSATLAINSNFEKATFDLQLSIPQTNLVSKDTLDAFISAAENLIDEHVESFKKSKLGKPTTTRPKTAPTRKPEMPAELSIPTDGWRLWDSGNGESLHGDFEPELFQFLVKQHSTKNPLQHSDGFNYWVYPDTGYIQRARRKP